MATSTASSAYQINLVDKSHSHLSPTIYDNLSVKQVPIPTPGPGCVLIRMHAAALNFRDLLTVAYSPLYPTRTHNGLVPCSDGAGRIVSVGPDSKWGGDIGTAVILALGEDWIDGDVTFNMANALGAGHRDGTLTQYLLVPDALVVRAPRNLTLEEAAALPGAAGTAVNALGSIPVGKGTIVVTQGTGGVSCAVIQYAAALGARVIATSSSDEKLQLAKRLGASELINYSKTPDWAAEVLRLTGGKGADLVCEVVGTLEPSMRALKVGGTAALIGFLGASGPVDVLGSLITEAKTLKGILAFSRVMLQRAVSLAEEHDIHPHIGKVFEWEDARKAFEEMRAQKTVGKIVIRV